MFENRSTVALLLLCSALVLGATGCGEDAEAPGEEETFVVPPGKADNFFSLSAQEYFVRGESYVEVSETEAALDPASLDARVKELVLYRQIAINWFLLQYLMGHEEHQNKYQSLTKNGSYEDLDLRQDPDNARRYTFRFQQEVGGQLDLVKALSTTTLADGSVVFPLPVGKVPNDTMARLEINEEWYRKAPWDGFDPAKVSADQLETILLTLEAEPRSHDAWIDYARLFADGKVDVGVHFGWDYHSEYHLVHSRSIYDFLVTSGFASPVTSYDAYTRTSGPLTRTLEANGRNVTINVWLYWGKPGTDTDPDTDAGGRVLEEDLRHSFETREVVIFSGHSGPFYGFALANWRKTSEGDLDDSEVAGLELLEGYQLVLAEGCDTYALGEAFWANPSKASEHELDVITTTNFSNASNAGVVRHFLQALFDTEGGTHKAWKYSDLLRNLDSNSLWFHSMYGVHGIDDNPHLHPWGARDKLCTSCSANADCGGPGNQCVRLTSGARVCAVECTTHDGCPAGYACQEVASGSWIRSKQCVPAGQSCPVTVPEPVAAVVINEVLADPAADASGDANGDGLRDSADDEFVELVNSGDAAVDLSGWSLADRFSTRFVFPQGTTLAPGAALVVFGGGSLDSMRDFAGELGAAAFVSGGLGLNNDGDTVSLADAGGLTIDTLTWGSEGAGDRALVRATDGDALAPLIVHPGDGASPGARQDGSAY